MFKDKLGREWRVSVAFGVVIDWKAELGFDLGDAENAMSELARVLLTDPFRFADLLWIACREAAGATTKEQFLRAMPADLDAAKESLIEATVLFFHGGRRAKTLLPTLKGMLTGSGLTSNESDMNSEALPDVIP